MEIQQKSTKPEVPSIPPSLPRASSTAHGSAEPVVSPIVKGMSRSHAVYLHIYGSSQPLCTQAHEAVIKLRDNLRAEQHVVLEFAIAVFRGVFRPMQMALLLVRARVV
eukprot:286620-Pelagomonas_calceolata.AAC.4